MVLIHCCVLDWPRFFAGVYGFFVKQQITLLWYLCFVYHCFLSNLVISCVIAIVSLWKSFLSRKSDSGFLNMVCSSILFDASFSCLAMEFFSIFLVENNKKQFMGRFAHLWESVIFYYDKYMAGWRLSDTPMKNRTTFIERFRSHIRKRRVSLLLKIMKNLFN